MSIVEVSGSTDLVGKKAQFIPAASMNPTVTAGCAGLVSFETTAGRGDIVGLDFSGSTDEHAQFYMAFGDSWNLGTVSFKAHWLSKTNTGTETVKWELAGVAMGDGDTHDVALGTHVGPAADANASTAEQVRVTAESGAVTIGGTPANGDIICFDVLRDVSDDTMTEDATLLSITLFHTTDAGNDA